MLFLTSREVMARAKHAIHDPTIVPATVASGAALGTSMFLNRMRPGGVQTISCLGAVGGGGLLAVMARKKTLSALGVGIMSGGAWSFFMRRPG